MIIFSFADKRFLAINDETLSDLRQRIDNYFGSRKKTYENQQNCSTSKIMEMLKDVSSTLFSDFASTSVSKKRL